MICRYLRKLSIGAHFCEKVRTIYEPNCTVIYDHRINTIESIKGIFCLFLYTPTITSTFSIKMNNFHLLATCNKEICVILACILRTPQTRPKQPNETLFK